MEHHEPGTRFGNGLVREGLATILLGAALPVLLSLALPVAPAAAGTSSWTAYVSNYGSDSVTPIATATNSAGTAIPTGSGPQSIAITPNGATVYVPDYNDNSVTPINTATKTAGTAIPGGMLPPASPSRQTGVPPTWPTSAAAPFTR